MKLKYEFIEPILRYENLEIKFESGAFHLYKTDINNSEPIACSPVCCTDPGVAFIDDVSISRDFKRFFFVFLYYILFQIQENGHGSAQLIHGNSDETSNFNLHDSEVIKNLNESIEKIGNQYGILYYELNGVCTEEYEAYLDKEIGEESLKDIINEINGINAMMETDKKSTKPHKKKDPGAQSQPSFFSDRKMTSNPSRNEGDYFEEMNLDF